MPPLTPHRHNGTDSPKLYAGEALKNAPQEALTAASVTVLTSGGANDLKTADSLVIANLRTRLNELEDRLQFLGLLK